jgi:superfamily I DNA/RNA helicase
VTLSDLAARLAEDHPGEMIGLIAAPDRARRLALGRAPEEVTVVPAPEARGLEFDTVILVDPDEIRRESSAGLRDLYVAQTRATKRLITLTTAPVAVSSGPV